MIEAVLLLMVAVGWFPIALRFLRGWQRRRNPVSLAICATVSFVVYANIMAATMVIGPDNRQAAIFLTLIFDIIVLMNFYASFRWARKRFAKTRRGETPNVSKQRPD